jgi:hypothetical protein
VNFEVGLGTYASSGGTITRTAVFTSSNSNNAVNWGIGTKNIFLTYPADKAVIEDASNNVTIGNNLVVGGTVDGRDVATDGTKLDFVTVTQAVDLDQMETDIAALANGMVYKGDWNAGSGSFPGGGSAQTGWFYYVSGAGTVNGISFAVGDNIVATTDNASTSTYASNWSKHDQTDAVQSVVGLTGSVSKSGLLSALNVEDGANVTDAGNVNPLVDSHVNVSSATSGQYLGWNGSDYAWSTVDLSTKLNLSGGTMSGDIDGNGNKVLFANVYSQLSDLPSASTYHGMFAHVHGTGKGYFAHAGAWVPLANETATLALSGGAMTGAITTNSTFDGRDVATDGAKLDGIEAGATTDQTDAEIRAAVEAATDSNVFTDADHSKLNGIEASADVTDTANVTAAGALMDSEVDADLKTLSLPANTTISAYGKTLVDDADAATARSTLGLGTAATTASSAYATAAQGTTADAALPKSGGTMTGNLSFGDSDKAIFGAGSDFRIYHDGSNSYIEDVGDGILSIDTNGSMIQLVSDGSGANGKMAEFIKDGAVKLYYDNNLKLDTTSYGVDITGRLVTTSHIDAPDDARIRLGDGDDLQIYHDGSNSYIAEVGAGSLNILGTNLYLKNASGSEVYALFQEGANNTYFYYNGSPKLSITSTGIDVTGNVVVSGTVDGRDVATDGTKLDGIASGATNVTNNNQLTNGAGYITSYVNTTYSAGSGLGLSGTTFSHSDTSSQSSVNNSGATVIQDVTLDTYGHVTGLASHTMTLANLGYTGATNANYITNNNQLTNGAGYTTNTGDITGVTAGTNLNGGGSSGGVTLNLDSTITLTTVNAGTVNTTSDERAKDDITPITGALNKVQQLGGYSFTLKATDEKSSGVIAQEVQKVMPELVQEGAEGLLSVQYGNMVGLLIEAIKEQQAQIDELKQKLNG